MVDWKDYLQQCKADVAACNTLYKSEDYGNAAYHLQQSLEKYVKAMLLHSNTITIPKSHIPLSESTKEIWPAFKKIESIAEKYAVTVGKSSPFEIAQSNYLDQCQKLLAELNDKKNREPAKVALWKNSLGIPLNAQDQACFAKYPSFSSYYRFNLNRVFASTSDMIAGDKFFDEVNNNPDLKNLKYYRAVGELGRMLAATFPHEDFGRYPTEIATNQGKVSSVILYKQHRSELLNLIEIVTAAVRA